MFLPGLRFFSETPKKTYLNLPILQQLQAKHSGANIGDVCCVGFIDFNVPTARQKEKTSSLIAGMSAVNDTGSPHLNCTVMILPDLPKDSSLRGLYDEEKAILESCFGLKQHCETRFVDLYSLPRRGEVRSSMRRFGQGRVVVNGGSFNENIWMSSELAVCGRAIAQNESERGAPTSTLPKSTTLLLPEASSPNADLKLAERTRPSPEQSSAQKGCQRLELLLESLFRNCELPGPVLIINLTGYVEEMAAAVLGFGL